MYHNNKPLISIRSDIYSLGVVAYEMMSGVCPTIQGNLRPLHELVPGAGEDLSRVINKMMLPQLYRRYPSPVRLREVLSTLGG